MRRRIIKKVLELLSDEEKFKKIIPELTGDDSSVHIYENFCGSPTAFYSFLKEQYKDKLVSLIKKNL